MNHPANTSSPLASQPEPHATTSPKATAVETAPLEIRDLTVAYHRKPVIWDIDYRAPQGKLVAIVGPNGAGKSTLITACLGLVPWISGEVRFFGEPLGNSRHRVGYVPQRESVDWDFPVHALDVVVMGLYRKIGWCLPVTRRYRQLAMEALDRVGMAALAKRQIRQLSGGQQQRVFLARALVQQADLYLMDEPFAGVDASTERAVLGLLRHLRSEGKTVLVVHHDLQSVEEYFDEVVLLNMRLIATGQTREVLTNENLRKTYGGRLALLDRVGERMKLPNR